MGRYRAFDYPTLTKTGFLLGLVLFLGGAVGSTLLNAFIGSIPGWLSTVLFDAEAIGLVIGFFSPFVFGILLPLTE
jgi:hypothetical protein